MEILMPKDLDLLRPSAIDGLMRVGRDNDGGYVIPRFVIEQSEMLLSFGLNNDWSFESHCLAVNPKLKIHAYDHTLSQGTLKQRLIDATAYFILRKGTLEQVLNNIHLLKLYRKFFQGNVQHFPERIHNKIDYRYDATLDKVFSRTKAKDVFVKIDIEGSEYRIVESLLNYTSRIMAIVVEFHQTDLLRTLFVSSVSKIKEHYELVHLHANNCGFVSPDRIPDTMEITFLRKDLSREIYKRTKLPVEGLDQSNDPNKLEYDITFTELLVPFPVQFN